MKKRAKRRRKRSLFRGDAGKSTRPRAWRSLPSAIPGRKRSRRIGNHRMSRNKKLRFGLPKGSLQDATVAKLAKAGWNVHVSSRSYLPSVDDDELEIRTIRAQEMSIYVERGYLDCGITGLDWIQENNSKVVEVGEFLFSKSTRRPAKWVLAVPENSKIKSVKGLRGKRIATEVWV